MGADAETRHPPRKTDEDRDCPRCGYDLAGEIDSWSERCPLRGVCTECGLGFAWGELLNPELRSHPWLYEHARSYRDLVAVASARALLATFARSLLPWSFWRAVRPHHKVVPKRLAIFVFTLFAIVSTLFWFVLVVAWTALEQSQRITYATGMISVNRALEILAGSALYPFGVEWDFFFGLSRNQIGASPVFIFLIYFYFSAFFALIALCAPSFWRNARTLPRHIFRITAYSLTLPILAYTIFTSSIAWEWMGEMYGSWANPAWWQRQAWLTDTLLWNIAMPAFLFVFFWQALFWWFGFRRGLGMRRRDATLLTTLCAITGVLGSMVCAFYTASL